MIYDLLVIGTEPEGLERALAAARAGHRVAVAGIEPLPASLDRLQQAVEQVAATSAVTMDAIRSEVEKLTRQHASVDFAKMSRAGIEMIPGTVRFVSEGTVEISDGESCQRVSAREIVIACGVRSRRPASFHVDGERVLVVESLLNLETIPRSAVIVGAGSTGLAAAILMARLGVEVTVADEQTNLFEICEALDGSFDEVTALPIAFRLGDEAIGTVRRADGQVSVRLASGRVLPADLILICVGGEGRTEELNLELAGVGVDEHGRLWCDLNGHTWSPRIVGVGNVVSRGSRTTKTISNRVSSAFAT